MYGRLALVCILAFAGLLPALGNAVERSGWFGRGVPLALIEDMLPADEIGIVIAVGVDRNTRIEWTDSENWLPEFLTELDGKGLRAAMKSNSIVIENLDSSVPQEQSRQIGSQDRLPLDGQERPGNSGNSADLLGSVPSSVTNSDLELSSLTGKGFRIVPLIKQRGKKESSVKNTVGMKLPKPKKALNRGKKSKYYVKSGDTLNTTLQKWAAKDSWTIIWNASHDYILEADAVFEGNFVSAASEIVRGMSNIRPQVTVVFYSGNKVLTVSNNAYDIVN